MVLKIRYYIYYLFSKKTRDKLLSLRETFSCIRYYWRLSYTKRATRRNYFYFVLDKNFKYHPGLADRLKAIVSCYYIAKQNNYTFRLIDQTDCGISEFLLGKGRELIADTTDLEYSLRDTRFVNYSASLCGLNYRLHSDKQYHCYCYQGDDIFFLNNSKTYQKQFFEYFNELFAPTEALLKMMEATGLKKKQYVAVHARFVNSLGVFESTRYPTLSPEKQEELIVRCKNAISEICNMEDKTVVLFSDSVRFLDRAKDLPVVILETKNISHLNTNKNRMSMAKTYLDFMLISRAAKMFRLFSNERELHLTNYSLYAAFAGGVEAVDYKVN